MDLIRFISHSSSSSHLKSFCSVERLGLPEEARELSYEFHKAVSLLRGLGHGIAFRDFLVASQGGTRIPLALLQSSCRAWGESKLIGLEWLVELLVPVIVGVGGDLLLELFKR